MKSLKLFLTLILISSVAQASDVWTLKKAFKDIPDIQAARVELTFTSGKNTVVYLPDAPPYGMVYTKKITLNEKQYFITGWAKGAATMLFRVFAPSEHKNKPLCEITSFSEESDLRLQKGKLELLSVPTSESNKIWEPCSL